MYEINIILLYLWSYNCMKEYAKKDKSHSATQVTTEIV